MATAYYHLPANIDRNYPNPVQGKLATLSESFDWSKEDAVPDLVFNEILWQGLKGTSAPSPVRAAFLKFREKSKREKDDDD